MCIHISRKGGSFVRGRGEATEKPRLAAEPAFRSSCAVTVLAALLLRPHGAKSTYHAAYICREDYRAVYVANSIQMLVSFDVGCHIWYDIFNYIPIKHPLFMHCKAPAKRAKRRCFFIGWRIREVLAIHPLKVWRRTICRPLFCPIKRGCVATYPFNGNGIVIGGILNL